MPTTYGNQCQHWRSRCTVDVSLDADNKNANVRVRVYMQSISWGFSIGGGISASFSSAGGGGSGGGSFSSGTGQSTAKCFIDKTVKIARKQGDFSTTIRYSVTNSSGYCNGTSSGSVTVTIPSVAKHTLTFNLNGGSGNFPNLTKWYGYRLYIHSGTPTRPLYEFVDWTVGGTHYKPGDRYIPDVDATFTANWRLAWVRPALTAVSAQRCDESGTLNEDGTHAKVSCRYEVKQADVSGGVITVQKRKHNSGAYVQVLSEDVTGVSGDWSAVLGGFSVAESYDLLISFSDRTQGVSQIAFISQSFVPLEFLRGGHAASFGAHVPDGVTSGLYSAGFPVLLKDGSNVSYDNGQGVIVPFMGTPVVLFHNDSQPWKGGITLSDSAANYQMMLIQYKDTMGAYGSQLIINPNGKKVQLDSAVFSTDSKMHFRSKMVLISGNTINTAQDESTKKFFTGHDWITRSSSINIGDFIAITHVLGWKTFF